MKVMVVSNHALIRESLVTLVRNLPARESMEPDFCTASSALVRVRASRPDVVLIDATADSADAIATVRALKTAVHSIRIVVIGRGDDPASVYEAISAGSDGYLAAHTSGTVLLASLEGIMRGELGLSRAATRRVVQKLRSAVHPFPAEIPQDLRDRLTPREREVFQLVRSGLRSREIAAQLSIAEATVYKHIQKILDKLHVRGRTQAVFLAEGEPPDVFGPRGPASNAC